MATTTFKYASHRDLKDIFPEVDRYDTKRVLRDWENIATNVYISYNSGLVTELFVDGKKLHDEFSITGSATIITTLAEVISGVNDIDTPYATFDVNDASNFQVGDVCKIDALAPDTQEEYCLLTAISTNTVTVLRFDSATHTYLSSAQFYVVARLNEANDWVYLSDLDAVMVYSTSDPADDILLESGEDTSTLINRLLVNGAMELNSMLDARFPIPIPPTFQYSSDPSSDTAEYDYVLKRANALITASHLAQTRDIELAESYYRQITNAENTGIIDRINDGRVKLSFERVENDSEGRIIEITKAGTMSMVELSGDWTGDKYDRVQVICTTGGGYGTAQVTVYSYDGTNLYGNSSAPITITGGMDYLINGISGRFEGNSLSLNDRWDFEVRRDSVTNPQTGSIELCR